MKSIISAAVLAGLSSTAMAGDVTADTNLAIGVNTILAKFERVTEVKSNEPLSVGKSLAIGANTILARFERVTEVDVNRKASPNVAKNSFIDTIANQNVYVNKAAKNVQANVQKTPTVY
jgi:hypothetical protein